MASLTTILLFFIYLWGFGYTITLFVKNSDNWLERNLMRIGFGFAGFALFGVLLSLFHISIDWKIFLIGSLVGPAYGLIRSIKNKTFKLPEIKLTKSNVAILIVLLIFSLSLFMYLKGSFSYPYFEDDDPYGYGLATKFIATEKSITRPDNLPLNFIGYIDPYPPLYTMLMGVLHQTSDSLNWTLKFFNSLIISLSLIFFYFFALKVFKKITPALFATATIAFMPAYLSHFIWSHSLLLGAFFCVMYAFIKADEDKRWFIVASIALAGILFTHQRQPFKVLIMLAIFITFLSIIRRKIQWKHVASSAASLAIVALWWLPNGRWIDQFRNTGVAERSPELAQALGSGVMSSITSIFSHALNYFTPTGGTGTRTYFFNDFFIAQKQNMINNPIGIGIIIYLLMTLGILALVFYFRNHIKEHKSNFTNFLFWIVLAFAGILVLRYITSIFGGMTTIPFLFSLWIDLLFFIVALAYCLAAVIISKPSDDNAHTAIWHLTLLGWLIAMFVLVSPTSFNFPIGIEPWRTWMFLAVPVALVATEGAFFLNNYTKKYPLGSIVMFTILIFGIFFTSGLQKYTVNTVQWPPGGSWSGGNDAMEEIKGYYWLTTLEPNTKVFPYSGRGVNAMAFDAFTCDWCIEDRDFRKNIMDKTPQELKGFLTSRGYQYILLDSMSFKFLPRYSDYTQNQTIERFPEVAQKIFDSGLFQPVYESKSVIVLRVN